MDRPLDRYIRSLAACLAPGVPNGQFVGGLQLTLRISRIVPEHVRQDGHDGADAVLARRDILRRLTELLGTGLEEELHGVCSDQWRSYGPLKKWALPPEDIVLPEHLPVARYNEQFWLGTEAGVTEEECKAAAAKWPKATATAATAEDYSGTAMIAPQFGRERVSDDVSESQPPASSPPPTSPAATGSPAPARTSSPASSAANTLSSALEDEVVPYAIQHTFIPPLQTLLEEACHTYIGTKMPLVLE